jgi:hypothetical protein
LASTDTPATKGKGDLGVSRARNQVQVFTDSRAALLEAVEENLGVRTAAVEAMGEVKPSNDEIERKETNNAGARKNN